MIEEEVVNRFLNMIATEYDGNLAKQFQNQYILKDKEIEQLQQENKQLKSILTELEEWLKETLEDYAWNIVKDKIQELKKKYK